MSHTPSDKTRVNTWIDNASLSSRVAQRVAGWPLAVVKLVRTEAGTCTTRNVTNHQPRTLCKTMCHIYRSNHIHRVNTTNTQKHLTAMEWHSSGVIRT